MKRFLILALAVCTAASALAQTNSIDELRKLVETSCVTADYSFVMQEKIHCSGTITVQQPCFKVSGNGMEIYCDGKSRWTVDREAKEVYIELTESPEEYLTYLSDVSDLKISIVRTDPPGDDLRQFFFDVTALDSSWVITDLRM